MTRSNIIDVTVQLHHETDKAVLVSETGDKKDAVWLPKSQVEIEAEGGAHTVTLPEWLALDKGLI